MLNILPPDKKIAIRRAYVTQQVRLLVNMSIITTSICVVMVMASNWMIQRWLEETAATVNIDIISAEDRASLKDLVATLNVLANQGQPLLAQLPNPVRDLVVIVQPTPSTIGLHSLTLDYEERSVRISGTADTREDVVAYQQLLQNLDNLKNVSLPLNDITQKTDVPFTFQATYETPPATPLQ